MTPEAQPLTHKADFHLTADNCDACGRISPSWLARYIITTAVQHADLLNIGYKRLISEGQMWVLSRLSFELNRWPAMFSTLTLETWIEDINRFMSLRNFRIEENGETVGYARSMWAAINIETRRRGDLTNAIAGLGNAIAAEECPIEPLAKLRDKGFYPHAYSHTIRVSDLDFNRHLTTARYIELMVNSVPLSLYDTMTLSRLDIHFIREAVYGQEAIVEWDTEELEEDNLAYNCRLATGEDENREVFALCRMTFRPIYQN